MLFSLGLSSAQYFIYKAPIMKVFGFEDHFVVKSAFFIENEYNATTGWRRNAKFWRKIYELKVNEKCWYETQCV